jgi:hypothetical protein
MTTDVPKTVTVRLEEPVTLDGGPNKAPTTYVELTFRRPKGRDLLVMDRLAGDLNKTIGMMASMAGVPYPVFEEMDAGDFARVGEEIAPLLGKLGRSSKPGAGAPTPEAEAVGPSPE